MHTFASVTDSRFLNKVVLEQIEIANAIISQQNGHIYVVCFQTGIVQADLSGPPSESFQNFHLEAIEYRMYDLCNKQALTTV